MNLRFSPSRRIILMMLTGVTLYGAPYSPVSAQPADAPKKGSSAPFTPPLKADETYSVIFKNDSNYLTETVTRTGSSCMHDAGPSGFTVPPGESYPVSIRDSNNENLFTPLPSCTDEPKQVYWTVSDDGGHSGKISFNHYDCARGTGDGALCIVHEALSGWKTKIMGGPPVDSAACDGDNCFNMPVKGGQNIVITALGAYQARPLTVTEPQANSRHEADYTLTPAGTATPGATVSFSLAGCPAGRSTDCTLPAVTAGSDGNWRAASRTLTISSGYTLTVTQTIDGHPGPNNPQTRTFTVNDADVNSQISTPPSLSWVDAGLTVNVFGSVTPAADAAKLRCYMDGSDTGVTPNIQGSAGSWGCRFPAPLAGKHTFSGRVEPEHPADNDAVYTYMIAAPLTVTAPAAGAKLYPPVTLSGTQQAGSAVRWTSDHCGSGTAVSTGGSWTTSPVSGQDACTFSFTQTWQEMTSPPVTRALTLEPPPVLTSPADVAQDTRYPLAGKGEPGATIDVSLEDGWYPIDAVTVGPDGRWSSQDGPVSGSGEYTLTLKQTMAGQPPVTTETPLVVEAPAATRDSGTEKGSTK
ncbi:hypothetical protein [Enterobacter ludwigii]|uniref:hypothetical protein n=1 Tax=Enterobacter ludwigii TaxID=299767 RepID=UPI003F6F83FB